MSTWFDPWHSAGMATEVMAASHVGPAALDALRAHRLARLLAAAAQGSAFFRRVLKGRDPGQVALQTLPVTQMCNLKTRIWDTLFELTTQCDLMLAPIRNS